MSEILSDLSMENIHILSLYSVAPEQYISRDTVWKICIFDTYLIA